MVGVVISIGMGTARVVGFKPRLGRWTTAKTIPVGDLTVAADDMPQVIAARQSIERSNGLVPTQGGFPSYVRVAPPRVAATVGGAA